MGAVAADTALRLLSGRAVGQPQPVEVHLVMTDRALLGTGDPDRSVFEPARIPGHGRCRPRWPGPGCAKAWTGPPIGPPPATCGRCLTGTPGLTPTVATGTALQLAGGCSGVGAAAVHDPGRSGPGGDGLTAAGVRGDVAADAGAA